MKSILSRDLHYTLGSILFLHHVRHVVLVYIDSKEKRGKKTRRGSRKGHVTAALVDVRWVVSARAPPVKRGILTDCRVLSQQFITSMLLRWQFPSFSRQGGEVKGLL